MCTRSDGSLGGEGVEKECITRLIGFFEVYVYALWVYRRVCRTNIELPRNTLLISNKYKSQRRFKRRSNTDTESPHLN